MKITKAYLRKIILEETEKLQEEEGEEEEVEDDELDLLGMQFDASDEQMAWARELEEGKGQDAYEGRPLEAPLAESFELEQLGQLAERLHDLTMWAITQGYKTPEEDE
tara:strand:- start:3046 stop:3369 length:324 start_codon:yes stop_codon:yes gene_type:complete